MSGIQSSIGVVAAFFFLVFWVRGTAPRNAQLLFTAAVVMAVVAELFLFIDNVDRRLSPILLLAGAAVLGPRLGRSLLQRVGHPRLIINAFGALGFVLVTAAVWITFATFKPADGSFDFMALVLLTTAGVAFGTSAERLHEDRYPAKRPAP